jgi:Transcription factor zinc-finger
MENEKHLLVEFDERANEDGYFAAKEHELIEEMKLEFHKSEAARRAAQMATCPKCSGTFEKYEFMGFSLDRCGNCEGIWLKKGELAGILRQQARGPLGIFLDRCFSKSEPGKQS